MGADDRKYPESVTSLRGKFFHEGNFHVAADVIELNNEEVPIEIRTPTVAVGNKILDMATVKKGEQPTADQVFRMRAAALVECIRDPETHERVFNDRDLSGFRENAPAGMAGWFQILGDRCLKILRGNVALVCKEKTGEKIAGEDGKVVDETCDTQLPPDAKFCPKCGKPAPDPVEQTKKN